MRSKDRTIQSNIIIKEHSIQTRLRNRRMLRLDLPYLLGGNKQPHRRPKRGLFPFHSKHQQVSRHLNNLGCMLSRHFRNCHLILKIVSTAQLVIGCNSPGCSTHFFFKMLPCSHLLLIMQQLRALNSRTGPPTGIQLLKKEAIHLTCRIRMVRTLHRI